MKIRLKSKYKNPYSKYNIPSGIITNNEKSIKRVNDKWLIYEITHGRGLPKLKSTCNNPTRLVDNDQLISDIKKGKGLPKI